MHAFEPRVALTPSPEEEPTWDVRTRRPVFGCRGDRDRETLAGLLKLDPPEGHLRSSGGLWAKHLSLLVGRLSDLREVTRNGQWVDGSYASSRLRPARPNERVAAPSCEHTRLAGMYQ